MNYMQVIYNSYRYRFILVHFTDVTNRIIYFMYIYFVFKKEVS